jgi:predicted DNA-binding protein
LCAPHDIIVYREDVLIMQDKNVKDKRLYVRLPASLKFRLVTVAKETGQDMSEIIRDAVEEKVADMEKNLLKSQKN